MKLIILLSICSILIITSCGNHNLPFIGTKYCSEASGVNYKIEISRNGNTKITLAGSGGTELLYDGKFSNDSVFMTRECGLIIQKDLAVYLSGKWIDTLPYIKEANW